MICDDVTGGGAMVFALGLEMGAATAAGVGAVLPPKTTEQSLVELLVLPSLHINLLPSQWLIPPLLPEQG